MAEQQTKKQQHAWGLKPNPTLKKYLDEIPRGKALDLGAGSGKNSLFLAQNGFQVKAIDKDKQEIAKLKQIAKENKLSIKTKVVDIKDLNFKEKEYSLIIASASLDFLKKSELEIIFEKIKKALKLNGFIYLLVFSIKDPMCLAIRKRKLKEIEENTFYLPKFKTYRHFFTKDEIKSYFKDYQIILLKQKQIFDAGHGQPHYHNIIEFIGKNTPN